MDPVRRDFFGTTKTRHVMEYAHVDDDWPTRG
jgi:hypothetical protein